MTTVIVADDHNLVRSGIRRLLNEASDISIIADVADGMELIDAVRDHAPRVVLTDISMPRLNGIEATHRITRDYPKTKVIILSMHDTRDFVLRALRAGASGFLPKDAGHKELTEAVRRVANGGRYFGRTVADHVTREVNYPTGKKTDLSHRQREVLQLIAEGHTAREIGELMHLSPRTVEAHRRNIMETLEIGDIAGLVKYAIRDGLVEL